MTTQAPPLPTLPARLAELTNTLTVNGWSFRVEHLEDMCGSPFIDVEAVRHDGDRLGVTWHTRGTGTYRLFSVLVGDRHMSYAAALNHATRHQTTR